MRQQSDRISDGFAFAWMPYSGKAYFMFVHILLRRVNNGEMHITPRAPGLPSIGRIPGHD